MPVFILRSGGGEGGSFERPAALRTLGHCEIHAVWGREIPRALLVYQLPCLFKNETRVIALGAAAVFQTGFAGRINTGLKQELLKLVQS